MRRRIREAGIGVVRIILIWPVLWLTPQLNNTKPQVTEVTSVSLN